MKTSSELELLNGVCPYFTMFPLAFPKRILSKHAINKSVVFDPFCGRGTTLYAGRRLGHHSYGLDANPVAAAISMGKLANTSPQRISAEFNKILKSSDPNPVLPEGDFWARGFAEKVLIGICTVRNALLNDCSTPTRHALRAILLGALHGPTGKKKHSYFSNQMPRTFSPKPRYSFQFWKTHDLVAPVVDIKAIVKARAERFFKNEQTKGIGKVKLGDSRKQHNVIELIGKKRVDWIITSPPYYGMRTYVQDQWLRNWFLGGPQEVNYANDEQLTHGGKGQFADELRKVWVNCASVAKRKARMVIRFGSINDRKCEALPLIKESLLESGWLATTAKSAGNAKNGRRQADSFKAGNAEPIDEYDIWCVRDRQ